MIIYLGVVHGEAFAFKEANDAVSHLVNFSLPHPYRQGQRILIFNPIIEEKRAQIPTLTSTLEDVGVVQTGVHKIHKVEVK